MGCNSDYLKPKTKEVELQKAANLLKYVLEKLKRNVSKEIVDASNDIYCKSDYVPELCSVIKTLSPKHVEEIVYDAHNKDSRNLAS